MSDARLDSRRCSTPTPRGGGGVPPRGDRPGHAGGHAALGRRRLLLAAGIVAVVASLVGPSGGGGFWIVVAGAPVFTVGGAIRGALAPPPWRRWVLIDRIARRNGMAFTPRTDGSAAHGMIFGRGHTRISSESTELGEGWLDGRVATADHRSSITTGSGKNRPTRVHRWAYLVVQRDRHLPHWCSTPCRTTTLCSAAPAERGAGTAIALVVGGAALRVLVVTVLGR